MRLREGREFAQVTQLVSWRQDSGPKAMNLVAGPGEPWEAWQPPPYCQWRKDETSVHMGIQEPPEAGLPTQYPGVSPPGPCITCSNSWKPHWEITAHSGKAPAPAPIFQHPRPLSNSRLPKASPAPGQSMRRRVCQTPAGSSCSLTTQEPWVPGGTLLKGSSQMGVGLQGSWEREGSGDLVRGGVYGRIGGIWLRESRTWGPRGGPGCLPD